MSFINSFVILLSMGSEDSIRLFKLFLSITCKIDFSIYKFALAMQPALILHVLDKADFWQYALWLLYNIIIIFMW